MRRDELTSKLRQPFSEERGFGVKRVEKAGYENIWFVVPPPPPKDLPYGLEAGLIGKANMILQHRPLLQEATDLDKLVAYLFARREAVSSSRMEGTWSTVDDVLTPGGLYPGDPYGEEQGKSEHLSVRGYAAALEYGLAQIERHGLATLTSGLVCNLHELVMSRDPHFQGIAGRLRKPGLPGDVVQIGSPGRKEEAIYNPAPPDHVAPRLDDLMTWMRDEALIEMGDAGMGMALPVRMAVGHAHFEAIHPFSDGNGRIGRILWSLQMAVAGRLPLYLSGYVEANRDGYRQALESAQKQLQYGPVTSFVARAVIAADEDERISSSAISNLPDTWKNRGRFRSGSSAARALHLLMRMPIVTVGKLSAELDVSFQAASSALKALESAGIVHERSGQGRNRIFAAEEVIAILARPFGEEPEIALEGARRHLAVRKR